MHLRNDGIAGFLLSNPPTAGELAEKIKILSKPEYRMKMGKCARGRALKHSWDRVADRLAELYLSCLR